MALIHDYECINQKMASSGQELCYQICLCYCRISRICFSYNTCQIILWGFKRNITSTYLTCNCSNAHLLDDFFILSKKKFQASHQQYWHVSVFCWFNAFSAACKGNLKIELQLNMLFIFSNLFYVKHNLNIEVVCCYT